MSHTDHFLNISLKYSEQLFIINLQHYHISNYLINYRIPKYRFATNEWFNEIKTASIWIKSSFYISFTEKQNAFQYVSK